MTVVVFLWGTFIIFMLSRNTVKKAFSKVAFFVDKIAGSILGVIGAKLVQSALFEDRKI